MDRAEKAKLVGELQDRFKQASVAMLATPRGLSVAEVQKLRRTLREVGGEYKVAKNTLARRAVQDTAYAPLHDLLDGPTGLVFGYEDPVAVAKALVRYTETTDKLSIKGGVLEQQLLAPAAVAELAKLPSREALLGQLLGLLQAPAAQLLRTIQEPAARVTRLLDQLRAAREHNA